MRCRYLLAGICVSVLAGCLSGEVLEGKIVEDHSGRPLPSVQVRVRQADKTGLVADLETNPDGRFKAPDLASGEYQIDVSKQSYAPSGFRVRLPAAAVVVRLVRFGAIAGQVNDTQGRPTRGATVFPMIQTAGGLFHRLPIVGAQVDDRGQYRLFNLPPGRYAVAVSWAGPNTSSSGAYLYPNNTRPEIFAVSGGEEYGGIDFVMPPQAEYSISGKVEIPSPRTRTFVGLVSVDQPSLPVAMKLAGFDGSFRLEGLLPGSYELMASSMVYGVGANGVTSAPQSLFGRMRVNVSQNVEGVTVALQKGRTVRLMLRTTAEGAGACPTRSTIMLSPLENFGVLPFRNSVEAITAKESMIENVPPGRYHVSAANLGESCFNAANPILDLRAGSPEGPFTVTVTAAGSIRGRLIAGAARPHDFVVVFLAADAREGVPPVRMCFPDAEGIFTLNGVAPGRYWLAARPAAEASSTRWVADLARMIEIEIPTGLTELELPIPKGDGS